MDVKKEKIFSIAMQVMQALRRNESVDYELRGFDKEGRENIHGCRLVAEMVARYILIK